jgi:hypothetical protein
MFELGDIGCLEADPIGGYLRAGSRPAPITMRDIISDAA